MTDGRRSRPKPGEVRTYFLDNLYILMDECKLWPYSLSGNGYGYLRINGKAYYAYRLACQAFNGPPPPGTQAAHGPCHNILCWNGAHLSWRTRVQNSQDRWRDGSMHHGETWVNSKLDQAAVDDIRAQVTAGRRQSEMADLYGVGRPQIHRIVHHKQWSPVE